MAFVGRRFFEGQGEGLAIEPELMGTPQMRNYHTMGWACEWPARLPRPTVRC